MTGRPDAVPGPRANLPRFPRPPPLAPSAPCPVAQVRSRTSRRLWRGLTSRLRSSLATGLTPPQRGPAVRYTTGQIRDLPVPDQGVSMHAGVSDHAPRLRRGRLTDPPLAMTRRVVLPSRLVPLPAPGIRPFRGSMASLALIRFAAQAPADASPCPSRN